MSGKSTVAATAASRAALPQSAGSRSAVNRPDASARWAALDSRHERLVTASDAVLADIERKNELKAAG